MPIRVRRKDRKSKLRIAAAAVLALSLYLSAYAASSPRVARQPSVGEFALSLDPAHSNVHYTLNTTLHTVHGEFAFQSGSMGFHPDSGEASGEFVVQAASGRSGNDSRDKRMHNEILEADRFMDVTFRPDRIDGNVALAGSSMVQVHGTFSLHGADHEIVIPVQVEIDGNAWKGASSFAVPYVQWGLKNPSSLFLKVAPTVNITLDMTGTLQPAR